MISAYWEPLTFQLPVMMPKTSAWHRWVDTALPSPEDICEWEKATIIAGSEYLVEPRSLVLLVGQPYHSLRGKLDTHAEQV
jgi:glycogen operon protein